MVKLEYKTYMVTLKTKASGIEDTVLEIRAKQADIDPAGALTLHDGISNYKPVAVACFAPGSWKMMVAKQE